MIKRIIGILAAVAIVVIVVFTALGCGGYQSLLPDDLFSVKKSVAVESQSVESSSSADDATKSADDGANK